MKNMVLVTHADFARGILTSLDLVLGQVGRVDYVSITAKETIPEIASMIEEKSQALAALTPRWCLRISQAGAPPRQP